jgi:hypothetical protein
VRQRTAVYRREDRLVGRQENIKRLLLLYRRRYNGTREECASAVHALLRKQESKLMADIILVAATLAFIAICVGYVNWCDRIIGPDDFGSAGAEALGSAAAAVSPDPGAIEPVEVTA